MNTVLIIALALVIVLVIGFLVTAAVAACMRSSQISQMLGED